LSLREAAGWVQASDPSSAPGVGANPVPYKHQAGIENT
jgi:hypothetical protein